MAADLLPQILPDVKKHIYPSSLPLSDWKLKEGEVPHAFSPKLNDQTWKNHTVPAPWGGYDKTAWFRKLVTIPNEFAGRPVALVLDLSEALVYVNGKPFQGVDANHQEVLLTPKPRAQQTFQIAIEAYSGRKKGPASFPSASLSVVNPTARSLYHGLTALHELEKTLGPSSPDAKEIKELVRQTLIFLKYFKPDGEEYPNAMGRALNFLTRTLETEYKTSIPGLLHLVAHSHIDVVWLWRLHETKKKCGRTFSTALRLMEEYPEFNFTQSQAQLYEFTKQQYPDLYKEIQRRVAEGRWIPTGSMWVEPDCNIPNGESLVRQILYGKRYFKREFGIDSNILWLPDTFGYSWALPQILKKAGIKYFSTTKLTWNDTTKFPYNTFWWKGIDGSKILTHLTPVGLEGLITPKDFKKSWDAFQEKEASPHVLQTFGYGDGGGGPTKEHLEQARILKTIAGLPPSSLSSLGEFFARSEEHAGGVETWDGEIYLEKHRGTYTTHGWVKRENRLAERELYNAELLAVLGTLFGQKGAARKYPDRALEQAWKTLLLNQFHDILPGTAIEPAYEDVKTDFQRIRSSCAAVQETVLSDVMQKPKKGEKEFHFSLFNPLASTRNEYVTLDVRSNEPAFMLCDKAGMPIDHQLLGRSGGLAHILCYVTDIPPFSSKHVTVVPLKRKEGTLKPWKVTPKAVETSLFRVRLDSKGQFTSLYDKTLKRELLAKNKRGNEFQTFKDQPKQWDAWDIDPEYSAKATEVLKCQSIKVVEEGPLRATLRVSHKSDRGSKVVQDIIFYHKLPRIDFRTSAFWKERQTIWKVAFPAGLRTQQATYEIQFGAVQRPTKTGDPVQKAKFEVPAQQWADLSEPKFGMSLLNDCKYGYDAKDNTLRLTLLRSPFYPHQVEPWRFNDDKITDQGEHQFTYALWPHRGDWKSGETVREARALNNPILVIPGSMVQWPSLLTLSHENIIFDSIKKAEESDEIVIRVHEAHGQSTRATMEFGVRIDQALECDLLENEVGKLKLKKTKLPLKFSPFEIKTLRVRLRPKR